MTLNLTEQDKEFITSPEDLLAQFSLASNPLSQLDFLAYRIYLDPSPPSSSTTPSSSSFSSTIHNEYDINNSKNHIFYELQRLLEFKEQILEYLTPYLSAYIWHQDTFNMKIIYDQKNQIFHLGGIVEFGNNIDDEWYIVWLLFQISQQYPQVNISITDMDGEFLLIESADYIPNWLGPENSENRVWIRNGKIFIIPIDEPGRTRNGSMQLKAALKSLENSRIRPNKEILKCIQKRISSFPVSSLANFHKTTCFVPSKVAQLLTVNPQLIATAVNTLCSIEHDKFYAKTLKSMEYFGTDEPVPINLKFTRALYAQLTFLQSFHAPQKFHQSQIQIQKNTTWNSQAAKAFDIGCRITCGLELAYQVSKRNIDPFRENHQQAIAMNTATLTRLGFDQQKLNSDSYSFLLNDFACFNDCFTADRIRSQYGIDDNGAIAGHQFSDSATILKFLQLYKESRPLFQRVEQSLNTDVDVQYSSLSESESDDWLNMTPEEFEKNMEARIARITEEQIGKEKVEETVINDQQTAADPIIPPESSKPAARKPVNTLYNKPPPSIHTKQSRPVDGDNDSDDDSMISNIWKPKHSTGKSSVVDSTSNGSNEQQQSHDVLQSIVRGMDVFLKTYSDFSGVENLDNQSGEGEEEEAEDIKVENELDMDGLRLTETKAEEPSQPINGLDFNPSKLLSLLSEIAEEPAIEKSSVPENSVKLGSSASAPPSESKPISRPTLDQPTVKSSEETMRKSIRFQGSDPTPMKPTLSTPHSSHGTNSKNQGLEFDLSSSFASTTATPQAKLTSTREGINTPVQLHNLTVTFDSDTSVLSGVAYAITPPRSKRTPPRLPTKGTPHPLRTYNVMSDEEEDEEEEEVEDNDDEDNQIDSDDEEENENDNEEYMREYMEALDEELAESTLAESFERYEDDSHEVDVERNLLKNLLESHASQGGHSGPTSNLLSQLGLQLPSPPSLTEETNN